MISLVVAALALMQDPAPGQPVAPAQTPPPQEAPGEPARTTQVKTTMIGTEITRPGALKATILVRPPKDPLEDPRMSPKKFGVPPQPWQFDWITGGYVLYPGTTQYMLRFRVYAQERKENNDPAPKVTRMLTTLWWESHDRIKLDHAQQFNEGFIDVFLCWGGKAGGEQRFEQISVPGRGRRTANSIYVYDVPSFTDPMEMAREVAHEYGHALLPPIGTYSEPEDWANGYMGEKLFLRWIRDGLASGKLTPDDAMGATLEQIDAWLAKNADPLIAKAATTFPAPDVLADKTAKGMNSYMGLALYAAMVLPDNVFGRSLLLTGSADAKDYPQALVLATEEPSSYEITIPKLLAGKAIWLPLGKGKLSGGKILKFKAGWTYVVADEGKLTVTNR